MLYSYFRNTGLTALREANAPFLKLRTEVPLDVPPSGNTMIGGYSPYTSISSCLSLIYSMTWFLASREPSLAIKIHPSAWHSKPKTGIDLSSFLVAKAGWFTVKKVMISTQDVWLLTYVDMFFGNFYVLL